MAFAGKIAHTNNNGTKSLNFTESLTFMKHETQKNDENLKLQELQIIIVHMYQKWQL